MKRLSKEQVIAELQSMGIEPAFEEFKGIHKKIALSYEGKIYYATLANLRSGKRPWNAPRPTDAIALSESMKSEGYIWEPSPVSAHSPITIRTPSGSTWRTTPNRWKRGDREPTNKSVADYLLEMKSEGFSWRTPPLTVTEKFIAITPDGLEWRTSLNKWSVGRRRPMCACANRKLSNEELRQKIVTRINAEWASGEYHNQQSMLRLRCLECNYVWDRKMTVLTSGCPRCANRYGGQEGDVRTFVESLVATPCPSGRLGRKQIDILVESRALGIEYGGLRWHSDISLGTKASNYHLDKMKLANQNGLRLITIFEDEWRNRQKQVKNFLRSVLSRSSIVIGARKCKVVEVPREVAVSFLDDNHIQGPAVRSFIYFGLEFEGRLVAVMSAGHHHRQGHAADLVLDRLCFADDHTVVGGASRLFSALRSWAEFQGYDQIVSWSDNRWSEGDVYIKLGFRLEQELRPDYSYVKEHRRFSKQSLKKTPEERLTGKTERQLREEQGYARIWDCGKKRWVYPLES